MGDTIKCSKCKQEFDLWVEDKPYCQKCFEKEYCKPSKEKPEMTPKDLLESGIIGSIKGTKLDKEINKVGSVAFAKKLANETFGSGTSNNKPQKKLKG